MLKLKAVQINNNNYLVNEKSTDNKLVGAMKYSGTLDKDIFAEYIKASAIGELQEVAFGNQAFTERSLTDIELAVVNYTFELYTSVAKYTITKLINAEFDSVLGKM